LLVQGEELGEQIFHVQLTVVYAICLARGKHGIGKTIPAAGVPPRCEPRFLATSNSAFDSPPPKVNVPVRCFQSSSDRP